MSRIINEDTIVAWMAENGHPEYGHRIAAINEEIQSLRSWNQVKPHLFESIQNRIEDLEFSIVEIRREALDRYNDWATD